MQLSKLIDDSSNIESQLETFKKDFIIGMDSNPKQLPSKYFYDDKGSELFQKITQQKEYYLNQVEEKILKNLKDKLPTIIGEKEIDIIELGAGDGHKTTIILDGFYKYGTKVNYYPIDISERAMDLLNENMSENKNIIIHGVISDYFDGIRHIKEGSNNKHLILFLGSNIGNLSPVKGLRFLRNLWRLLNNSDHLLIGFDLKKDIEKLIHAYNDDAGVTKEFNLNILKRINKELDANFDTKNFIHYGTYNPIKGAMESFLISTKNQKVVVKKVRKIIDFEAFEPMHVESSYKFSRADIELYGKQSGFSVLKNFVDNENMYIDSLWKVENKVA